MEQVKIKIVFYKITDFGYFSKKDEQIKPFGTTKEFLEDLEKWMQKKTLKETALPSRKKFNTDKDGNKKLDVSYLPTYLLDVVSKKTHGTIVALWNKVTDDSGRLVSISANSSLTQLTNEDFAEPNVKENHIPGFPTYFWFLPDGETVASIRLEEETRISREQLIAYFKCAMRFPDLSRFVKLDKESKNGNLIVSYVPSQKKMHLKTFNINFALNVKLNTSQIAFFMKNASNIRKVHSKNSYKYSATKEEQGFIKKFFGYNLPEKSKVENEKIIEITSKIDVNYLANGLTLTANEVVELIKNWEQNHENSTDFDDLGFQFKNKSSPVWLSHSIQKAEFILNLEWLSREQKVVNPKSLLNALHIAKTQLLNEAQQNIPE